MPVHWADRVVATWRIKTGGFPYHLCLLQLAHDASFRVHSGFALDDRIPRTGDPRLCRGRAAASPSGVQGASAGGRPGAAARRDPPAGRRHRASRAGCITSAAASWRSCWTMPARAVTVNSTAAQQVLWRGLPLKVFGRAVYAKPEFVSTQPPAGVLRPAGAARQPRLSRLPALPAGNQPDRRRLLFRQRAAAVAAAGGRHDAGRRKTPTRRWKRASPRRGSSCGW